MSAKSSVVGQEPGYRVDVIAGFLDISARRVQQLVKQGVIPKPERGIYPLVAANHGYLRYLRSQIESGSKKLDEDARLKSAQADLRTLELAEARSKVVSVDSVEKLLLELQPVYFSDIDALPARLAPELVGQKSVQKIRAVMTSECQRVRVGVASRLDAYLDKITRRGKAADVATNTSRTRRVGRRGKSAATGTRRAGAVQK